MTYLSVTISYENFAGNHINSSLQRCLYTVTFISRITPNVNLSQLTRRKVVTNAILIPLSILLIAFVIEFQRGRDKYIPLLFIFGTVISLGRYHGPPSPNNTKSFATRCNLNRANTFRLANSVRIRTTLARHEPPA